MATIYQNLSDYNPDTLPNAATLSKQRFAIAVADWNSEVTYALRDGAVDTFLKHGVKEENIKVVHVPGAFELTYAAKLLVEQGDFDAVIVLGCVIQGDTPHFDYVCQGVTEGITRLNSRPNSQPAIPVIFGVLTVDNQQQALDRAGGVHGNKGVEGAITAIKMANLFCSL